MKKRAVILPFILLTCFGLEANEKIRRLHRTFSTFPAVDEFKRAVIAGDKETINKLISSHFPQSLHAQYVHLGLSNEQPVRDLMLNEIFKSWNIRILEHPEQALGSLKNGIKTLAQDYGSSVDKGFLQTVERLQAALLMCPAITSSDELNKMVLELLPINKLFMTAYTHCMQGAQAGALRARKAEEIKRSRPSMAVAWPIVHKIH